MKLVFVLSKKSGQIALWNDCGAKQTCTLGAFQCLPLHKMVMSYVVTQASCSKTDNKRPSHIITGAKPLHCDAPPNMTHLNPAVTECAACVPCNRAAGNETGPGGETQLLSFVCPNSRIQAKATRVQGALQHPCPTSQHNTFGSTVAEQGGHSP
jgi:hypothetical protein